MKQWLVLCLFVTVAFSGCFGFLEDDATDDDPDATDDDPAQNVTNTAPTVDFTANRTEGEAPLDVRFDLNASDADGDNLTWTLDADGDGAVESNGTGLLLPFNFTFTYDAVGVFNATLNVTDGTNATVAVLPINVTEALGNGTGGSGNETGDPYFLEDADDNTNEWTVGSDTTSAQPDWEITDESANSGSNSWGTSLPGPAGYADEASVHMTSPTIDLSAAGSVTLEYAVHGGSELDFDFLHVQVSNNGGGSWQTLTQYSGEIPWTVQQHDLSKFAGGEIQLRFLFTSDSNCSGVTPVPVCDSSQLGPGWFVDDIVVQ